MEVAFKHKSPNWYYGNHFLNRDLKPNDLKNRSLFVTVSYMFASVGLNKIIDATPVKFFLLLLFVFVVSDSFFG